MCIRDRAAGWGINRTCEGGTATVQAALTLRAGGVPSPLRHALAASQGAVRACGRRRRVPSRAEDDAGLAAVATGLVLVAVVHDDLQAIRVPRLEGHAPLDLGTPAFVLDPRRDRVIDAKVPVVLRRVNVRRDRYRGRRSGIVDRADRGLPGAVHGVGVDWPTAHLPVADATVRI